MISVPGLEVLNDSFENRKLLSKLPEWLVTRWNRIVVEKKEKSGVLPPFSDFEEFVTKEAKIASDPVTSLVSLKGTGSNEQSREPELAIIKVVQSEFFANEITALKQGQRCSNSAIENERSDRHTSLKGLSRLSKLDPFLDPGSIIRVGGRIQHASLSDQVKYPIILPRKCHVTEMVIRFYHGRVAHQGRGLTTNAIRSAGFWVIGCSSAVSFLLSKCVICRKLRSPAQGQKMADLPVDRLEPAPPFTYCGVDLFGPFYIKEGRKELKRYGVLFTCLLCRAVHVETVNSLETDSFINCLRRFIAVRGPVRQLRSDRGTNFVGADNELKEAFYELNHSKMTEFLIKENCDLVDFKMNVPSASHMGESGRGK
ncbi:uncharacterized protein LOC132759944 [Ruditapes philippinarum]|uniref:uncharacterized protein LOC132759944 n=1 Tax=Ruditapes philippinarum TaxID=129788 RepID=UPI00295B66F0|nr:uncharacterized protein LOC132759944 [Ruditapes philippinarum]